MRRLHSFLLGLFLSTFLCIPSGSAKIITEKDPISGEVTLRSVPDEDAPAPEIAHPTPSPKPAHGTPASSPAASKKSYGAGAALIIMGGISCCVIGGFWLLVKMAQEHVGWLIGGLLISPVVIWIFLFAHPSEAKRPMLLQLFGVVVILVGYFLGK